MSFADIRRASGMTQKEFSEYLHIPRRTIENWDDGQRVPPPYVLELIEFKLRAEGKIKAED